MRSQSAEVRIRLAVVELAGGYFGRMEAFRSIVLELSPDEAWRRERLRLVCKPPNGQEMAQSIREYGWPSVIYTIRDISAFCGWNRVI